MPPRPESDPSRREFLQTTVATGLLLSGASAATADTSPVAQAGPEPALEWRNRQPGMAYRRLGRTNLMVSEVVSGGDPITLENYKHLNRAIDRGLNYLDMAPAYHGGQTEQAYGKLLAERPGLREQVFLTTKISGFSQIRWRKYRELFDGLGPAKQDAIRQKVQELLAARGVRAPGYYLTYYPGQQNDFEPGYLVVAMRDEYGAKVEGSPEFRRYIVESLEGSLKRVGTDHFDLMMCPHGAAAPEELEPPEIHEVFQELRQQGKVRFLGATSHNDPAGTLRKAAELGTHDAIMMAYNVVNGGYVEEAIRTAAARDIGMIAMKSAMAVATHHKPLQPVPEWRIAKVNRIIPGDELKPPQKAYLWSLQNPHITAVISNLWDEAHIDDNLALAGRKVDLQPA